MRRLIFVLAMVLLVSLVGCANQNCTPEAYEKCYEGDVYWYDSCDNRGDLKVKCVLKDSGEKMDCENGECMMPGETETTSGYEEDIDEEVTQEPEEPEQNKVEKATSLDMTVKDVTNGDLNSHDRYRYENLGEENAKLRIDVLSSSINKAWILDNTEDRGWLLKEDGRVKTFSEMDKDFSSQWDTWMQSFESWRIYVESNWEPGKSSYGYSTSYDVGWGQENTTITIYDVKINPDFSDSVFNPS